MLPVLINEHLIQCFNFYLDHQIRQGMRHGLELYRLVCEFSPYDRLQAYQQACELLEQGGDVVISASALRYAVWMNLRSRPQSSRPLAVSLEVCSI